MARLLLSKATLSAQRQKLAAYQRFLPALDMKRQQLQGAIKQVEVQLQQQQQQQRQLEQRIAEQMPMLAETSIDLQGLCSVNRLRLQRRNIVGVWVNELDDIEFDLADIPLMAKPHWVAPLQQWLKEGMTLDVQQQLLQQQQFQYSSDWNLSGRQGTRVGSDVKNCQKQTPGCEWLMTIVALKKVAIAGREKDKDAVVAKLQAFGQLHLISAHESGEEIPEGIRHLNQAIRFLQQGETHRRPLKKFTGFHLQPVVDEALEVQQQLRNLEDQRDDVQARMRRMSPWGGFQFPGDTLVNHIRLWFYRLPVSKRSWLDRLYQDNAESRPSALGQEASSWQIPWQLAGRDSRFLYVVLVSATEPPAACMPVPREHLGSRSLAQLTEALENLEQSLDSLQSRREELTRYLLLLKRHQARTHNHALWRQVVDQLSSDGQVFSLVAWVPVSALQQLTEVARETGFAFVATDPQPDETPPTLLRPLAGFAAGRLLTRFYQLPAYRSWDPSVHLYLSFVVFFAMILSDGGYALALGGLLALRWTSMGKSESGRGLRQLALSLVGASLVWGMLAGSYFGLTPAPGSWLAALVVVDINHYNAMM